MLLNLLLSPTCLTGSMAAVSLAVLVSGFAYSSSLIGTSLSVVMSYTVFLPSVSLIASLIVMTSYLNGCDFGEAVYLMLSGVLLAGWLTQAIIWTKCETARATRLSKTSFCPRSRAQHHNQHNDSYIAMLLFGYLLVLITASYIARIVAWRLVEVQKPESAPVNPVEVDPSVLLPPMSIPSIRIELWDGEDGQPNGTDNFNICHEIAPSQSSSCPLGSELPADSCWQSHTVAEINEETDPTMESGESPAGNVKYTMDTMIGTVADPAPGNTIAGEHRMDTAMVPSSFPRSSSVYSQSSDLDANDSYIFSEAVEVDLHAKSQDQISIISLDTHSQTNKLFIQSNSDIMFAGDPLSETLEASSQCQYGHSGPESVEMSSR